MHSSENLVDVPGYEGLYLINRLGQVISLHKRSYGTILTATIRRGYYTVQLSKDGNTSTLLVHRLVAAAFIPKIEGKDLVNHKNFNRLDNRVENLEWVTHKENMQHAHGTGLLVPVGDKKPVINTCTGERFESAKEAAAFYGMNYRTLLSSVLNHPEGHDCIQYES